MSIRSHVRLKLSTGLACAVAVLLCLTALAQIPTGIDGVSIRQRIADRTFPSVFQAWNPADNLNREDPLATLARHDLCFHSPGFFGLKWQGEYEGLATRFTPESIDQGLQMRRTLLRKNPHLLLLAEIRYRDAFHTFLPEGHRWWLTDRDGKPVSGWKEGNYLCMNFADPAYQTQVATQARAAVATGVFDGVMLDWWTDDQAHLQLIQKVREAVGPDALILVNANDHTTPQTAPYVNGYFMECYRSKTPEDWQRISDTLSWAETHLRMPHIDCVETWFHTSRQDLPLMRSVTTLALTRSDGYCLFSDPNDLPTPDHLHDWYPFWNKSLGKPLKPGVTRPDGSAIRIFENGTALYNPMGNAEVTITFPTPRTSLVTGKRASVHTVPPGDGDLFLATLPQEGARLP